MCVGFLYLVVVIFCCFCLQEFQGKVVHFSFVNFMEGLSMLRLVGRVSVHHPREAILRTRHPHISAPSLVYGLRILLPFPRSVPYICYSGRYILANPLS